MADLPSEVVARLRPLSVPLAVDWNRIEAELERALPETYKRVVETYGHGWLEPLDIVLLGSDDLPGDAFLRAAKAQSDTDRDLLPHAVFPEPQGLLAWARGGDGYPLYWRTRGAAGEWTVVVPSPDGLRDTSLVTHEFLANIGEAAPAQSRIGSQRDARPGVLVTSPRSASGNSAVPALVAALDGPVGSVVVEAEHVQQALGTRTTSGLRRARRAPWRGVHRSRCSRLGTHR